MVKCPCKGCENREVGCHSNCAPYLAFKKDNDERRIAVQKEKYAESYGNSKYYMTTSGYWRKRNRGGQN